MLTPRLTAENLVLRPFELRDLGIFAAYRSLPVVAKYQSWETYSYQDALALFERIDYSAFGEVGQWYQLAISAVDTDELLGDLAVHFIDNEQIEIGFTIDPAHQRLSIATKAVASFVKYAFGMLKTHRVIATTDAENVAAYKLLEKLGFRREAHFVQNIFFKGAWGSEFQYALLRSEHKTS